MREDPAASTLPTQPSRRRGEALLDAIFDAVIEELAESGYHGLTVERVAERAHAGKASIYRRWHNRLDLVVDALDSRLPSYDRPPDTGSLREDLIEVLGGIARGMSSVAGGAARACFSTVSAEPEVVEALRERVLGPRKAMMLRLLERAAARGQARPEAVTARVAELGPVLLHSEILEHGPPLREEVVAEVVDDILLPLLQPWGATATGPGQAAAATELPTGSARRGATAPGRSEAQAVSPPKPTISAATRSDSR